MSSKSICPSFRIIASLFLCVAVAGPSAPAARAADAAGEARAILDATGVRGGLVVHLGTASPESAALTTALRANPSYTVQGLFADAAAVEQAREIARKANVYGKVSIDQFTGKRLPFIDNLVTLIVAEDASAVPEPELMRVLAPRGVAYVRKGKSWTKKVKPRPAEIDQWTHYMHDSAGNAVAHDSVIAPPRRLQWVGSPRWGRHHDHMSSVSAVVTTETRTFTIFDEATRYSILPPSRWRLIARDAFNGCVLWKRKIPTWHTHMMRLKSGPSQLARRLVAEGDRVYVTLGLDAPLTALDAATGKTLLTYKDTGYTQEILLRDGVLLADVLLEGKAATKVDPSAPRRRQAPSNKQYDLAKRRLMAFEADSGKLLWQKTDSVVPGSPAMDATHVCYHDGEVIVCLDRATGKEKWRSKPVPVKKSIPTNYLATLILYEDLVFFSGGEKLVAHQGGKDTFTALSAKTGEKLWSAPHPPSGYQSPEDLFVAGGLVWCGATVNGKQDGVFTGRDPGTGEVKVEFPPNVETYWFHHRCYRGKATDKYLLISRTGIEFVDIAKKSWTINHWIRGACLYGIMPANGMIYAPQHPCACYPEAKMYGFTVVAPAARGSLAPQAAAIPDEKRLTRGPAYGVKLQLPKPNPEDWPTFRHDAARSGRAGTKVPAALKPAWDLKLGGKLSSVAIAGGLLYVARVDQHTVHSLDAKTGKEVWQFTAGGRVDSPPTIWQGRALFGSADGSVYCLRADTGELMWRFLAAPTDERLVFFEQVESVWPVHGTILVQDGVACFAAGRSAFLDGGICLYRLDAVTGKVLSMNVMDDRDPQTGKDLQERIMVLNMPVALPDIMSSDGRHLYMHSQVFDMKGKRTEIGPHSGDPAGQGSVQRGDTVHLFSPTGFLDDSWWHRTYWVYGRSFAGGHAGYSQAGKFAPAGRILAFDDERVYAFGRKQQYYRWTTPIEYHLFSTNKVAPEVKAPSRRGPARPAKPGKAKPGKARPAKGRPAPGEPVAGLVDFAIRPSLDPSNKPLAVEAWIQPAKPNGVVIARGGPAQGFAIVLTNGRPAFLIRSENTLYSVAAPKAVGMKKWTHVAGVLTADKQLQVYVNGTLAEVSKSGALIASDPKQGMQIGGDLMSGVGEYGSPYGFNGLIDEVRLYVGPVSADEIAQHESDPKSTTAAKAKLVLHCSFDDGKATDSSRAKNHGTVGGLKTAQGKLGKALQFTGSAAKGRKGGGRKGPAPSRFTYYWSEDMPILVRAMTLTPDVLFVAGPRDIVDENQAVRTFQDADTQKKLVRQVELIEGKDGAVLKALSPTDGAELATMKLDCLPAFDGMAAANGRLYLVTADGRVLCLEGK